MLRVFSALQHNNKSRGLLEQPQCCLRGEWLVQESVGAVAEPQAEESLDGNFIGPSCLLLFYCWTVAHPSPFLDLCLSQNKWVWFLFIFFCLVSWESRGLSLSEYKSWSSDPKLAGSPQAAVCQSRDNRGQGWFKHSSSDLHLSALSPVWQAPDPHRAPGYTAGSTPSS